MKSGPESDRSLGRLICLTNIPTPYRLHFFAALSEELKRRGWEFEAWFMANTEPGRHWRFDAGDFSFPHKFFRGTSTVLAGAALHFNREIVAALRKHPPDVLLVAGSWAMPTNILAVSTSGVAEHSKVIFWSESHLNSTRRKGRLVEGLRKRLLKKYDSFAVPGSFARDYVSRYAPGKPVHLLPNTVNEKIFRDEVRRLRANKEEIRRELSISDNRRVLLIAARLAPEKGVMPFLSVIGSLPPAAAQQITLLIAGEGRMKRTLETWIARSPSIDARLLGHVAEGQIARLYAAADSFALPSLFDPNPLSVIEALWAGLPLILSDKVGNHPEALCAGENGWLFDPESLASGRKVLEDWLGASLQRLEQMGNASARIAGARFNTEIVARNFVDQLLTDAQLHSSSYL